MLLANKNAVIHGAGGSIGGAAARAFAREGARVFLAGRTRAALETVAAGIRAAGGVAETAEIDALDEQAVDEHTDAVAARPGGIDPGRSPRRSGPRHRRARRCGPVPATRSSGAAAYHGRSGSARNGRCRADRAG